MLGLQALESGSPGISASRPRTRRGLRTLMRRIPQPQVWEDGNDHKPLVSSPRACGLGERGRTGRIGCLVQPTRMRAWGPHLGRPPAATCPAHAHAGLGKRHRQFSLGHSSSPRACGLGASFEGPGAPRRVQPTRMRAWGWQSSQISSGARSVHAHAGLGSFTGAEGLILASSPRACGLLDLVEAVKEALLVQPTRMRAWTLAGKGEIENGTVIMLGLQALESGSPGMSTSRPRTRRGLRTLMRRIPQPQAWEDGSDHKPLVSSPRACGLGGIAELGVMQSSVQPTRMRAWGRESVSTLQKQSPAHAHAGLDVGRRR